MSGYCNLCGRALHGRYTRYTHPIYAGHPLTVCGRCQRLAPQCRVCHQPMRADRSVAGLCAACAADALRCLSCGAIITGVSYTISGRGPYCATCQATRQQCDVCGVPLDDSAQRLPDGRALCGACLQTAIIDASQAKALFDEAEGTIGATLGLRLRIGVRFVLTDRAGLRVQIQKIKPQVALGLDHVLGVYVRDGRTRTIYIENGLPKILLIQVAAHEWAHAWQMENCPLVRDVLLVEGFADWVAYKVLQARQAVKKMALMTARADLYGKGLHADAGARNTRRRAGCAGALYLSSRRHGMNLLNNARLRSLVAGGIGGFIGWLLTESLVMSPQSPFISLSMYASDAIFGALAGVAIGGVLGLAGGLISYGATQRAWITVAISAAAGLMGGALGLVLGEAIYQPLRGIPFLGRSLGWAAFGAILGAAEGITRRSAKGFRNAALGGLIGGALGGFAFDLMLMVMPRDTGVASRAIDLTIVGACIGIFIVLMEKALADGLLKVVSGRQEGREFYLDKPVLTIGRDEQCDVPLFNDPTILPQHATIRQESGRYVLHAEPGAAVLVNKQPISQQALAHENEVIIGGTRLIYRSRKAMSAPSAAPVYQPSAPIQPPPPPLRQPPQPPVQPVRYCRNCNTPNRVEARFCAKCGKSIV